MRELMFLIRSLAEEDGRTLLISSHQLYQIQQVCDRVGLFVEGQLIACGRIDDLAGQMRREGHYVLEAAAIPDDRGFKELLEHLGNVEEIERSGDFYVIYSSSDLSRELNRKALEGGYSLCHLRQRGNDLDEIYRTYFEKGEKGNGSLNQRKSKGFLSFGREQRQGEE
ncbi:MAG: ABC transporter ATP-binding protein, partial [Hungatella sp.]